MWKTPYMRKLQIGMPFDKTYVPTTRREYPNTRVHSITSENTFTATVYNHHFLVS